MDRDALERRFAAVLEGLGFPAARWQIVAAAEYYGADGVTLQYLYALRAPRYSTIRAVVDDVATTAAVAERLGGR